MGKFIDHIKNHYIIFGILIASILILIIVLASDGKIKTSKGKTLAEISGVFIIVFLITNWFEYKNDNDSAFRDRWKHSG
jgi:drug/metabolite transporter superfamily protein YnfA